MPDPIPEIDVLTRTRPDLPLNARLFTVAGLSDDDLETWIQRVIDKVPVRWLRSEHRDGLVWGRISEGTLHTASDAVRAHLEPGERLALDARAWAPKFRLDTLHELWLFGPEAAVHLVRDEGAVRAVALLENGKAMPEGGKTTEAPSQAAHFTDALDEHTLLWGTHVLARLPDGFAHVRDASAEVEQVLPVVPQPREDAAADGPGYRCRPVYLRVRGYRPPPGVPDDPLGYPVYWRPLDVVPAADPSAS